MTTYEHTTLVLQLEKKNFALTRKDVFQGLSEASGKALGEMGGAGWELVAALPISSGSAGLTAFGATDAVLGLFMRVTG